MHKMLTLCLFIQLGCSQQNTNIPAYNIDWNGKNLVMALDELERKCSTQPIIASNEDEIKKLTEEIRDLRNDVDRLDATMDVIRQTLDTVQEGGISHANLIPFDPRETTLEARNLQSAMTEMMQKLASLEHKVYDDLGEPGPGLFALPKNKQGNGPSGPPPNGGNGGPGGPSGPPPNGGNGGNNGNGGQGGPPP